VPTAKANVLHLWCHNRVAVGTALLAFGLVFATSGSRLRLVGPVGVGELCLAVWLVMAARYRDGIVKPVTILPHASMLPLWPLMLVGIGIVSGWLNALRAGYSAFGMWHDAVAYLFCGLLIWSLLRVRLSKALFIDAYWISAFFYLTIWAGARWLDVAGTDDWFRPQAGVRWTAFAKNPNQLAFMLLPIPFLAALRMERGVGWRWQEFLLGASATVAVIATESDAAALALIVGGGVMALLSCRRDVMIVPMVLGAVMILCGAAVLMPKVLGSHWGSITVVERGHETPEIAAEKTPSPRTQRLSIADQTQISVRVLLWRNALRAWKEAPIVGWGPGSHSGFTGYLRGRESREAHNVILDIASQGGVLAVIGLVWWLSATIKRAWNSSGGVGVALIVALIVFAQFHFVGRQPLFWILPLMASEIGSRRNRW